MEKNINFSLNVVLLLVFLLFFILPLPCLSLITNIMLSIGENLNTWKNLPSINMRASLYLFLFCLAFSYTTSLDLLTKFNITIKTPGNTLSPPAIPYVYIFL